MSFFVTGVALNDFGFMGNLRVFFILFLSMSVSSSWSQNSCDPFLNHTSTVTVDLQAYLQRLIAERVIVISDLEQMSKELEQNRVITNPMNKLENSAQSIHHETLEKYLKAKIDKDALLAWLKEFLQEHKSTETKKNEVQTETKSSHNRMEFKRVEAGSYKMHWLGFKPHLITLTHPIEVMTTPVTQLMWAKIMGTNPSHFANGPEKVTLNIDGKEITLQPNHPVEKISWLSALFFANEVSKLHGLPPVYDLHEIEIEEDFIKRGVAHAQTIKIKINAPHGDIYQAKGFRLPTHAEQEFILTDRGRSKGKLFTGVNSKTIDQYAWYSNNSDGETHSVAVLAPFVIDGENFYDLFGNVDEWAFDFWSGIPRHKTNPVGDFLSNKKSVGGGYFGSAFDELQSSVRRDADWGSHKSSVGFRLVRSLE